ncbi:MAG TPA: fibronectin type III domain-containing protein [Micromonosporaceae bacterium]|nr:fibronectin type III domain-containing protein [Micromonosporaceae bacterium]
MTAGPRAAVPAGGMSAGQVMTMFGGYGDAGGHWTGGGSTASVPLPDGRVAWLFSNAYLGAVNADGSRPESSPMVPNTLVVQDGAELVGTLHGGSTAWPEALVKPDRHDERIEVQSGIAESGVLKVVCLRYRRFGDGIFDTELMGTSLATFALPALALSSVVDLPVGRATYWGSALLVDGSYTYVYGMSPGLAGVKYGHVARAAVGSLDGAWQFWDGTGWSAAEVDAARLLSGVGTTYAVQRVGSDYVLVTQENNLILDPQFVAYTAPSPTGPWSGPIQLLTAPEQKPGTQRIVYSARLHPELARPGKLLMSYDVNSLDPADSYADARLYRPRFVELDWPRPQLDPARLPAAPADLAVSADATGAVHLTWSVVAGATGYHVYRRDVTGGQTHLARQWQLLTQSSAEVGGLVTGHCYELRVTAANAAGEGLPSAAVSAVSHAVRDASVIRLADTPNAVPGSYLIQFNDSPAVRSRGVEAMARELLAQSGGTVDHVFALTLNGFIYLDDGEAGTP